MEVLQARIVLVIQLTFSSKKVLFSSAVQTYRFPLAWNSPNAIVKLKLLTWCNFQNPIEF